jgi:4'-phosphopantetheinyl transferase EntD
VPADSQVNHTPLPKRSPMDRPPTLDLHVALVAMLAPSAGCFVAAIGGDDCHHAQERALMTRAVPARRREFAAGRRCAHAALAAVGALPGAIGRGPLGEPLWPAGFSGSITHGSRFAAAVAGPVLDGMSYGVDLVDEVDPVAFAEAAPAILTEREARSLGTRPHALTVARVFSAKEAVIKLLSPRLGRVVGFPELETRPLGDDLVVDGPCGEAITTKSRWIADVLLSVASAAASNS